MIRRYGLLLVVLFLAVSAHAQFAGYATVTVGRLNGIGSSPYAASYGAGLVNDSINPVGGTFGVYYDFKSIGPIRLGADARAMFLTSKRGAEVSFNGTGSRVYSTLGGVRGSFRTPFKIMDGYVQGSAGLGRSDYGLPTVQSTKASGNQLVQLHNSFEYHAFAGLQLHVTPMIDFRVAEVGYGALQGGGHTYPLKSVSTGLVFHFPPPQ